MKIVISFILIICTQTITLSQTVFVERPADNTRGIISTNGSEDAGVFCADYF